MASTLLEDSSRQPEAVEALPEPPKLYKSPERLGMKFDQRLLVGNLSSFLCGFTLGVSHAGHMAGMRFRAENAHRLPETRPGWYLYHKSKNYYKIKEAAPVGIRKGFFVSAWTSIFLIIEESLDIFRGTWYAGRTLNEMEGVDELDIKTMEKCIQRNRDFKSSAIAGMVTGGVWSAWNTFPMVTAARTIRMGLFVGLAYGLGQDAMMWARNKWGVDEAPESWIYKGAKNKMKEAQEEGRLEQK